MVVTLGKLDHYHRAKFYVIDDSGRVTLFVSMTNVSEIMSPIDGKCQYLVPSLGIYC